MADKEDEELDEDIEELEKEEKENERYYEEPSWKAGKSEFQRNLRDVAREFNRRR